MWQSNGDEVEEAIFSDSCAQPACATCTGVSDTQSSRFAWPYIAKKVWPYYPYAVLMACGVMVTDSDWPLMSRGYSNSINYGGLEHYNGAFRTELTFKGIMLERVRSMYISMCPI